MKLLFNKNSSGKTEIKKTLGFLDAGFTYDNLEPDIKLQTPYLIDLISQDVYDKIHEYYLNTPGTADEDIVTAIEYIQLYVGSLAYANFSANNDLTHSNSGRSFRNEENEKIPFDHQIARDHKATVKRAYKALDLLFILLDKTEWSEWTDSEAYKTANELFIKNTNQFDKVFPIDKSGQLYYRLVPFMDDFETDDITPILTADVVTELKEAETPTANQKTLIKLCQKAVAYLSLGKALNTFPVEMMPEGLMHVENTNMKSKARAEVMLFLNNEGKNYLTKLEHEYSRQTETFTTLKTTNGLEEGKKYVNL